MPLDEKTAYLKHVDNIPYEHGAVETGRHEGRLECHAEGLIGDAPRELKPRQRRLSRAGLEPNHSRGCGDLLQTRFGCGFGG